jgi:pyruvate/oxaloacetate carboxyltransferase
VTVLKKLDSLETALTSNHLGGSTKNTDRVEKAIQEPGIELCTTVKLYDALLEYLFDVRQKFDYFEKMAKDLEKKWFQGLCRLKAKDLSM